MVGDRLMTDVLFGNTNDMATVYVHPFETPWDKLGYSFSSILRAE